MTTIEKPNKEAITRPPSKWLNWWSVDKRVRLENGEYGPGDFPGDLQWPSRDVAEQKAVDWLLKYEPWCRESGIKVFYVGAYPEGVTP